MLAKVAGMTARNVIDFGAELNHISLGFCQKHKIATGSENATATMANGSTEKQRTTKHPLTVNIGGTQKICVLLLKRKPTTLYFERNGATSIE